VSSNKTGKKREARNAREPVRPRLKKREEKKGRTVNGHTACPQRGRKKSKKIGKKKGGENSSSPSGKKGKKGKGKEGPNIGQREKKKGGTGRRKSTSS